MDTPLVHCSNSAAAIALPEYRHALVRIGIGMYGYYPSEELNRRVIGLGIDEGAALEVRGSLATVLGDRTVAVFDARRPQPDRPTRHWLSPGDRWDLVVGERVAKAPPSGR